MKYTEPTSRLLKIGRPKGESDPRTWPDYLTKYGFTTEHLPELLDMLADQELVNGESFPDGFALIHSWRVITQLVETHHIPTDTIIPVLLNLMAVGEDIDWLWEEVPYVFSRIGPDAIPGLCKLFEAGRHTFGSAITALSSLSKIAEFHADHRQSILDQLVVWLEESERNALDVNGDLVAIFLDHKYAEALPAMEKAFEHDTVDSSVAGDWEDVQIEFGLLEKRITPRELTPMQQMFANGLFNVDPSKVSRGSSQSSKKNKGKRKQAQKSRKQNRKKKK